MHTHFGIYKIIAEEILELNIFSSNKGQVGGSVVVNKIGRKIT